jgi:hypothetical protein
MVWLAMVNLAFGGCSALTKPDAFGVASWSNEGFKIGKEAGKQTFAVHMRKAGMQGAAVQSGVLALAFDDGTIVERPLVAVAVPENTLWEGQIPVTEWWFVVDLDPELLGTLGAHPVTAARSTVEGVEFTMTFPSMTVQIVSEANADKRPAVWAKQATKMAACLL